jgi:hypothetical protein
MKHLFLLPLAFLLVYGLGGCGKGASSSKAPVSLSQVWASDSVLRTPESVLFDSQRQVMYVSNINKVNKTGKDGDGFLSRLSANGEIRDLYWLTGLNDPKGLGLYNEVLYVADLTEVVAVSVASGSVLGRYTMPGVQAFNDVTVDRSGNVFISDPDAGKIYRLYNGQLSLWSDNAAGKKPNGLLAEENRLLSAWMEAGQVKSVNWQTKAVSDWVTGVPSTDGIAAAGNNDYFVSNWNGEVYYINSAGKLWKVLDTKDQKSNTADIDFSVANQTLYVPTFYNNRVVAYRLSR